MLRDPVIIVFFAFDKESIQCTYFFCQISLFTTFISKKSLKENCKRRAQLSQRVYMSTVRQPYHSDNKFTLQFHMEISGSALAVVETFKSSLVLRRT